MWKVEMLILGGVHIQLSKNVYTSVKMPIWLLIFT